jgi:transposase InsO family protein
MCKVFKVSSSGYYYWLKQPVSLRKSKQDELLVEINKIYQKSKCRYGSPRITIELKMNGIKTSRPRVARLMRKAHIRSIVRKKYRVQTTDSNHGYALAENLLNRDFSADKLAEKWVSDITYIPTGEGWLYLTSIMDLADRKIIGWALSDTMKAEQTTVAAWKMALTNRPVSNSLIFHSDRGIQYACGEFRKQLLNWPVLQSMSRKGNCWDNAVAESFFKTMKTEMVYHKEFNTGEQAKLAVFEYIEIWYNRERRHSTLGYLTPCDYEKMLMCNEIAA